MTHYALMYDVVDSFAEKRDRKLSCLSRFLMG